MGIHGLHRPREWDAVAVVDAPGLPGDEVVFVALPDGSFVLEDQQRGVDLSPLARALELSPPYRAEAVRRTGQRWAVGARAIEVIELALSLTGGEIEIVWDGSERSVLVDGEPTLASFPPLERFGEGRSRAWVVRARRLRAELWEVEVEPL